MKLFSILFLSLLAGTAIASPSTGQGLKCDTSGRGFFAGFLGTYAVHMQMKGGGVFEDELVISCVTRKPGMAGLHEQFAGTFTVPGIFSVPTQDGVMMITDSIKSHMDLKFSIIAQENGRAFLVHFVLNGTGDSSLVMNPCLLTGRAYSPTPGVLMADVTLKQKSPVCDLE